MELVAAAESCLVSPPKSLKIIQLNEIAENSVDILGIGLYSLGKHRKTINKDQKKTYNKLFREYFLKSFD